MISENIEKIKEKIKESALKVGRNPDEVTLMAVSKTKPIGDAVIAAQNGVILGENYVQEFREKFEAEPALPWHFIGHLQTNKVKYIVGKAKMIHSADSLHLIEKINSESEKRGIVTDCLAEINSGCEESKFGLTFSESLYIIKEMAEFDNIRMRGLMTVAPFCENGEDNREILKRMMDTFLRIKEDVPSFDTLSMGMSADFAVAVEEGATLVRVGTAIFGARNYNR